MRKLPKVLVADPSAYMAALTVGMLRNIGAQSVTTVSDSAAARVALHRETFNVIVIDDMLTPVDGIELTRQLRASAGDANRLVPVVMVFAEADRQRIEAARDAGVTEFIKKPLSAKILEVRIARAIEHPRPFITAAAFAGPDRRRKSMEVSEDRRGESEEPVAKSP
jgi:two-component system chemotaxis response regulator CheY